MMKKTRFLTQGALIAAVYAGLSLMMVTVSFGPFQFRLAEVLTVLPLLTPAAIPGLFVGCIIVNLFSPFGIVDIVFGSTATLLAATATYLIGKYLKGQTVAKWLAPVPPILFNALIIGGVLTYMLSAQEASVMVYLSYAVNIAVCEAGVCYALGVPLLYFMDKNKVGRRMISLT